MARSKNAGFTLLELLLVIVIMGIVASFTYLSVSNVGASAARKAANDTQYLLSRCRSACLSRTGESYLQLKLVNDQPVAEYYESGSLLETKELGGGRVTCSAGVDALAALTGTGIKISFQRSTGAEKKADGYSEVKKIAFSGGGAEYTVNIVPETGAHSVG